MTQKKRIKKKAKEKFGGNDIFNERRLGFIEGAEWMLNNQWISIEEELPEKSDVYITLLEGSVPYVVGYSSEVKQWCSNNDIITHWMAIPS